MKTEYIFPKSCNSFMVMPCAKIVSLNEDCISPRLILNKTASKIKINTTIQIVITILAIQKNILRMFKIK